MTEDEMREMFGDANPFSDFFKTFFGGGMNADEPRGRARGARGARAARAGRDVEQEIELGLEDAYHGTMRRFSIRHDGDSRTVDVRIPAGVSDGSRVRVSGEGEEGSGGAQSGDLYLRIRLAPHPRFERKGRDLHARVPIPLTTAVLGGETEVQTLGGKSLRLKIPPTTQNGQVFRLKGHGMPAAGKPAEHGDLYATVDVQLPRQLTPEQRKHFEALQKLEAGTKSPAALERVRQHEHQQVHRESARGGGVSHRARATGQQSTARAGTSPRGARRAARGHCPRPSAKDECRPGAGRQQRA